MLQRKKQRIFRNKSDLFDGLHDDLVVSILCKLSSSASCPSDFINILLTYVNFSFFMFFFYSDNEKIIKIFFYRCKRLNRLALQPIVLCKASSKALFVKSKKWSDSAHRFLKQCVAAGNIEACYTLGMVSTSHKLFIYIILFLRKITSKINSTAVTDPVLRFT